MEPDDIVATEEAQDTAPPPACFHLRVMRPDGQFYTHAFSPGKFEIDTFSWADTADHLIKQGMTAYSGREADFYRPVRELAAGGAPVPIWFSVNDGSGWSHYQLLTFIQ